MTKLSYELAEECIKTNYYGAKATSEILLPLLQLSDSPRIVIVSSSVGQLKVCSMPNSSSCLNWSNRSVNCQLSFRMHEIPPLTELILYIDSNA